ncbi:MAG: DnaJ family domain-containing protein [Acidiferrobacterales bacterium]
MWFLNKIAEARIAEAIERGEFDNLPGAGKPLVLDNDASVPEELRAAYRVLKNAGYLPRELELRREIADVSQLVTATKDQAARVRGHKRISYLMAQLQAIRGTSVDLRVEQAYYEKLLERLNGP